MLTRIAISIIAAVFFSACSSSRAALKRQDYYSATLIAIQKLHTQPTHKRSISELTSSYPMAIEILESSIKGGIESNNPNKWQNAIDGFLKINTLAEKINASVGARKIIKDPVLRYSELARIREKAAEEVYQKGIELLMTNKRNDAKNAIRYFTEAKDYQPDYREVVEMINKAEYVATVHVGFELVNKVKGFNLSFEPQINDQKRPFLSFSPYNPNDSIRPQQKLTITFSAYRIDSKPTVTSESGEKENRTSVQLSAQSEAIVRITDLTTGVDLIYNTVQGNALYSNSFTKSTSSTGISKANSGLHANNDKIENTPLDEELLERSIENLKKNIGRLLNEFYSRY